jgi:hypothetical protein
MTVNAWMKIGHAHQLISLTREKDGTSDGLPVRATDGPLVPSPCSSPLPVHPNRFYHESLREENLNDDGLYETANRIGDMGITSIVHELRRIRDQAYSVGYRHGYADAVTDLEA